LPGPRGLFENVADVCGGRGPVSESDGGNGDRLPRGTVTFLLTDIEGSTRNWEASPSTMQAALLRHYTLLNADIAEHSGHVLTERGEGDSFFAVFERASDAVAAATALQLALHREPWPEGAPMRVSQPAGFEAFSEKDSGSRPSSSPGR
jgi:class 3 adenylate cyclase